MSLGDEKTTRDGVQLELSESQQAAIEKLARDEVVIRPAIRLAREAVMANDAVERAHAEADPEAFWAERAEAVEWIEPWREVLRFDPPHHEWFVGGKLNATANCLDRHVHGDRRNKAAILWVGRGRRGARLHVQPALPRGQPLRQRPEAPGRGQGRPRHPLHAARSRGDHHDARLRAHRRHPLGGLRRHGHAGAALADRGLRRARRGLLRLHAAPRQEGAAQADRRRGGARADLRRARRRPPPRLAPRRRAGHFRERAREGLLRHPERARHPLPAGADGRRGPALHPLHVGHHRAAQGRGARDRRLHGRRHLPRALLLPDRRARHLLVAPPTSAGSSATPSSSTARSRSAPPSSAARACPTTRRRTSPGSWSSATASTSCSPRRPRCACG